MIFPESGYGIVVLTNTGLSLLSIDNLESLAREVAALLHGGDPPDVLSSRLKEVGVLVLLLGTTALVIPASCGYPDGWTATTTAGGVCCTRSGY